MMEKQSLEFITGYIFSKIENQIIRAHTDKHTRINPPYVYVPKSWFGLGPGETLSLGTQCKIDHSLKNLCNNYNTRYATYTYSFYMKPKDQYICFLIEGTLVLPEKEMTIAEIEKELGYKIKIVGEH